jgi:hypothetical protein
VHTGDKITGTLTFDGSGAVKTFGMAEGSNGGYQSYTTPGMRASFKIGNVQQTVTLYTTIFNNSMFGADQVRLMGDAANESVVFSFTDGTMRSLSSLDIPDVLDLTKFTSTSVSFYNNLEFVSGTFGKPDPAEAGAPSDVPEPASLALFGVALASLSVARRKRMR